MIHFTNHIVTHTHKRHETFFTIQHPLIPIIHPGRYITAFYSAPHLRPPMALQYAIWTMATTGHPKYHVYHDAFHSRARHYLQEDEMRVSLSLVITIFNSVSAFLDFFYAF